MSAFENAKHFFAACETSLGWEGCKEFVSEGATFSAQCEPLVDIHSVREYSDWMAVLGTETAPGATYDLHSASFCPETRMALFFATFHVTHTGAGGPVPPTHRKASTHYVYALKMNEEDRVESMTKIWNAPWAMRELGWTSEAG